MPQLSKVKVSGSTVTDHTRRTPSGDITEVQEHERREHYRELQQELKRTTPRIPAMKKKLDPEIVKSFKGYRKSADSNYDHRKKELKRSEKLDKILEELNPKKYSKNQYRALLRDHGVYGRDDEWRYRNKKVDWLDYGRGLAVIEKDNRIKELKEATANKKLSDKINVEKEIIRAHVLKEMVKEVKTEDKIAKQENLANYKDYKEKLQNQITKEDIEKVAKQWQITPREKKIDKLEKTTREHWPEDLHLRLWYDIKTPFFSHRPEEREYRYTGYQYDGVTIKKNPHYDKEYEEIDKDYTRKTRQIDKIVDRITKRTENIKKAQKMGLLTKTKERTNMFETADGSIWVKMDGTFFKTDVRKKRLAPRTERGWKSALHKEPKKIVKMYDRAKIKSADLHRELWLRREEGVGLEDWLDNRSEYEHESGLLMDRSRYAALASEDVKMVGDLTTKSGYQEIDPSKFKVTEEKFTYNFPSKRKRKVAIYSKDTMIPLLAGAVQEKTKKGVKTTTFDSENYTWVAGPSLPLVVQPKGTELYYLLAPMQPDRDYE